MVELVQFREAVQFFQIMFAVRFSENVRQLARYHDAIGNRLSTTLLCFCNSPRSILLSCQLIGSLTLLEVIETLYRKVSGQIMSFTYDVCACRQLSENIAVQTGGEDDVLPVELTVALL